MKGFVCIVCPASCRLTVEDAGGGIKVSGNGCARGEKYGVDEFTAPKRMLTTTVKCLGGILPRLPVISTAEIPREKMFECLEALYRIAVNAPVECGDLVLRDICGTGVDIAASRTMTGRVEN